MYWLFDFLFPPRTDEKILRSTSTDAFLALVTARVVDYTRPGTIALLPFHNPQVRAALHEAKYHGSERAFALLGTALAEYLRDNDELNTQVIIIPIPLGKIRTKERGFNQVYEMLHRMKLDLTIDTKLLLRTRETASQVSLPREKREENMRGAFRAVHSLDPAPLYIVVDDVITTGATLQAAIGALTEAGARHIIPLALAH